MAHEEPPDNVDADAFIDAAILLNRANDLINDRVDYDYEAIRNEIERRLARHRLRAMVIAVPLQERKDYKDGE
jgi:hypothetical protein